MLGLVHSGRGHSADAVAAVVSAVEGRHLAAVAVVVARVKGGGPANVASVGVIEVTTTAVAGPTLICRKEFNKQTFLEGSGKYCCYLVSRQVLTLCAGCCHTHCSRWCFLRPSYIFKMQF